MKTRSEAKKATHMACPEDSTGNMAKVDANAATLIAKSVMENISPLIAELQSTLDKMSNRIADNSKRIIEAENRISDRDDHTYSPGEPGHRT